MTTRSVSPDLGRLLRKTDLVIFLSLSRAQIDRMVAADKFPMPIRLSPRRVAWQETDVLNWLKSRPRQYQGAIASGLPVRPPGF
jgi:predicted DNA-binding transcriptional regulator AlpA